MSVHTAVWFEIPTKDLKKAISFYERVFKFKIQGVEDMGSCKMGILPAFGEGDDIVHGALVQGEGFEPSDKGAIIYMNGGDDLSNPLARVVEAGGRILQDKFSIGEHGHCAYFADLDGNRIGLHSRN